MTGGLAFEAMNNAGHLKTPMLIILNDNEMSISPNVGALNTYLTKIVTNPVYNQIRNEIWDIAGKITFGKKSIQNFLRRVEECLMSFLVPGMLFEELGFRYFGAIDGLNLRELISTLDRIKDLKTPALRQILTKKGKAMVSTNTENNDYYLDAVKFHAVKPNGRIKSNIEN